MTSLALGMADPITLETLKVGIAAVGIVMVILFGINFAFDEVRHAEILRELRKLNPPPTEAWEKGNAILRGKLKESDRREERER